jgi:hypothetical protein
MSKESQLIEGYENFKGFEVNSIVICVDAKDCISIKEGDEYTVLNQPHYHNMRGVGVEVSSPGTSNFYHPGRFISKEELRNKKIQTILE